jgi:hypothetical protein
MRTWELIYLNANLMAPQNTAIHFDFTSFLLPSMFFTFDKNTRFFFTDHECNSKNWSQPSTAVLYNSWQPLEKLSAFHCFWIHLESKTVWCNMQQNSVRHANCGIVQYSWLLLIRKIKREAVKQGRSLQPRGKNESHHVCCRTAQRKAQNSKI